jgi:hypothetical protein
MFRKFLSILTMGSILLVSSSLVFGKSKGDWSAVENLVNQEVAVKTRGGMNYGIIKLADSNSLVLRVAGKKGMTRNEIAINRNDVKKVWRALLFVNSRNIGKGALIGAGAGLGAGLIYLKSDSARGDGQAGIVPPYLAAVGAGVGGLIGFFARKVHKKQNLVYKK